MRVTTSVVKIIALASHVAAAGWGGDAWGCNTGDAYGTLDDSYFGYGTNYPPEPCAIGGDVCPLPAEATQYAYAPQAAAPQQQSQYYSPCEYASISFPEYSAPQAENQQPAWQSVDDTWVPEPAATTWVPEPAATSWTQPAAPAWTQPAVPAWVPEPAAPEYVATAAAAQNWAAPAQNWAVPEYVAPAQTWTTHEYAAPAAASQPCPVQPAATWNAAPAATWTVSEAAPAAAAQTYSVPEYVAAQAAAQNWTTQPAVQSMSGQQVSSWEQPAVQSWSSQPAAQQAWGGQQETVPISVVFDGQMPATSVAPSTVTVGTATYPISAPASNPQAGGSQQLTQADIQDLYTAEQMGAAAGAASAVASGAAAGAASAAAAGSTSEQLKKQQGANKADEDTKGAGKKGGDKKKGGKKKSGASCPPKKGGKRKANGAVGMALVSLAVAPLFVALL